MSAEIEIARQWAAKARSDLLDADNQIIEELLALNVSRSPNRE
jgi:hypothetical protein